MNSSEAKHNIGIRETIKKYTNPQYLLYCNIAIYLIAITTWLVEMPSGEISFTFLNKDALGILWFSHLTLLPAIYIRTRIFQLLFSINNTVCLFFNIVFYFQGGAKEAGLIYIINFATIPIAVGFMMIVYFIILKVKSHIKKKELV